MPETSKTPLGSIDAALLGINPRYVFEVLQQAISDFGRDQALHMRFYTGDVFSDLPPYIKRARDLILAE